MKHLLKLILVCFLISSCGIKKPVIKEELPNIPLDSTLVNTYVNDKIIIFADDLQPNYDEPSMSANLIRTLVQPTTKNPNIKIVTVNNNTVSKSTVKDGRVVYKIPTEMRYKETSQVILRISKSSVTIYDNLEGEVKTTMIPTSETMEVKLIDPSPKDGKMFDIVQDNSDQQIIEDGEEFTQWSWNVTPIKTGKANLKIVISVIKDGKKKETVYEDNIKVKIDVLKQLGDFIDKYWQWCMSTLILPFGIWFYNKRKKKEE
jgi:hypothetical protein